MDPAANEGGGRGGRSDPRDEPECEAREAGGDSGKDGRADVTHAGLPAAAYVSGGPVSIEETSWGQIKSLYR
jgi:hypothetical protein